MLGKNMKKENFFRNKFPQEIFLKSFLGNRVCKEDLKEKCRHGKV